MAPKNDALSAVELAEAEAAEAEAQAAAAQARVDALRSGQADDAEVADAEVADAEVVDAEVDEAEVAEAEPADADADDVTGARRGRSIGRLLATAVAALLLAALLGASGYMVWQGHRAAQHRAQEAAFAAAARQGVVNLMSLDFNKGDADLKRLIDSTTGQFRDDFEKSQNDFLSVMKDEKVVTTADVKATAVDTMTDDSADVLVAASSHVSNSAAAQQPPRGWRLLVTVQRDNGQLKMSKVEFVP